LATFYLFIYLFIYLFFTDRQASLLTVFRQRVAIVTSSGETLNIITFVVFKNTYKTLK